MNGGELISTLFSTLVGGNTNVGIFHYRNFKYYRVVAIQYVLQAIEQSVHRVRCTPQVLGMGAIAVWMWNATVFRPGEQRWETPLMNAAAFWDSDDEDNLATEQELEDMAASGDYAPALQSRGLYFLSAIEYRRDVFCLPAARSLSDNEYAMVYNVESMSALQFTMKQSEIQQAKQVDQVPRQTRRILNRAHTRHSPARDIPLGLDNSGVRLRAPRGFEEVARIAQQAEDANNNGQGIVDREVNIIWQEFLRDIIAIVPTTRRGVGCYCTLDSEAKSAVTEATYQATALPFKFALLKIAPMDTWDVTFFNRFFPSTAMLPGRPTRVQHWPQCHYWMRWTSLLDQVPDSNHQEEIRIRLRHQFKELVWLPWSASDKIWQTSKRETGQYQRLPAESGEATAVRIAVNERSRRILNHFTLV